MPAEQCTALTSGNYSRCSHLSTNENGYCTLHNNKFTRDPHAFATAQETYRRRATHHAAAAGEARPALPVVQQLCAYIISQGKPTEHRCNKHQANGQYCHSHHALVERQRERQADAERLRAIRADYSLAVREVNQLHNRNTRQFALQQRLEAIIARHPLLDDAAIVRLRNLSNHLTLNRIRAELRDQVIMDPHVPQHVLVAIVNNWVLDGMLTAEHGAEMIAQIPELVEVMHIIHAPRRHPRFGPERREAQLAFDPQNVHTNEISQQMRTSIAMLMEIHNEIPSSQTTTMNEIYESWQKLPIQPKAVAVLPHRTSQMLTKQERVNRTYNDVVQWWNRDTIFLEGDKLFRKCLRALWYSIKRFPDVVRRDLENTLFEECESGVGMCTQGHMARLSNVLVGYDDAYKPQVSTGEMLQQKMAAISQMEIHESEQRRMAGEVLRELNVPAEQHAAWLEAF